MSDRRHRCPSCLKEDGLWEAVTVPGWRSLDAYLRPTGESDFDRTHAERDDFANPSFGCSCGWEGSRDALEVLGIDGAPLAPVHPDQLQIEAA